VQHHIDVFRSYQRFSFATAFRLLSFLFLCCQLSLFRLVLLVTASFFQRWLLLKSYAASATNAAAARYSRLLHDGTPFQRFLSSHEKPAAEILASSRVTGLFAASYCQRSHFDMPLERHFFATPAFAATPDYCCRRWIRQLPPATCYAAERRCQSFARALSPHFRLPLRVRRMPEDAIDSASAAYAASLRATTATLAFGFVFPRF